MTNSHGIELPYIPPDLLSSLEARYPDRCPDIQDSDRVIWFKAGQRQVVNYLIDQQSRQKEADRNTGLDGLFLEGGAV